MASIGQLSAGIAHEINNPVGFITSNLQTLSDYFNSLEKVLKSITQTIGQSKDTALNEACQKILKQGQVDFILEDTAELITESLEGSSRVMSIVKNLKEFSHVDRSEWSYANLENCIESTLKIINNEIKYNITLEKHYAANVPMFLPADADQSGVTQHIGECQPCHQRRRDDHHYLTICGGRLC